MNTVDKISTSSSLTRTTTSVFSSTAGMSSFVLGHRRSYNHQYSNIYFYRLRQLRRFVEERALVLWGNMEGNPRFVPKVLEVVKSQICYIVGTVYLDMPLKPNVMEDIARDFSIPPPPPPDKFYSPDDNVMLEDESGRIELVGERLKDARLVTGVIVGVLGLETPDGEFEVLDICYPGMAPQASLDLTVSPQRMEIDGASSHSSQDEWIGIISGLSLGSNSQSDGATQALVEFLTGEAGGIDDQVSASQISRLIVAGNSLTPMPSAFRGDVEYQGKKARKQAQDLAAFTVHPIKNLAELLSDVARVMPIHLLPGDSDPAGTILPQQAFPRGMFGTAATFSSFSCETNPTYLHLGRGAGNEVEDEQPSSLTRTFLIHSGQPLNDIFKYLPSTQTRLGVVESTLQWRHMAPTAPDTLWCHPYYGADPFMIMETPHAYIVGGQDKFATKMVVDGVEGGDETSRCRLILVPSFAKTGTLILLNLRSLDVKTISFAVEGMSGNGHDDDPQPKLPSPSPPVHHSPSSSPPMSTGSNFL